MPTRQASAHWDGDIKRGAGKVKLAASGIEAPYSFASRFESGTGTNPEELLGASHAGCYTMALTFALSGSGHAPTSIDTTASVHLSQVEGGFAISKIDLETVGVVPGIDDATFQKFAEDAKKGCPISKALASVPEITLKATLKH